LQDAFEQFNHYNEDDVKLHFYSEIVKPLLEVINPHLLTSFKSENKLVAGGRTDATFQNISFEYKAMNHFHTQKGLDNALFGRDSKDHGLYDYILKPVSNTPLEPQNPICNARLYNKSLKYCLHLSIL